MPSDWSWLLVVGSRRATRRVAIAGRVERVGFIGLQRVIGGRADSRLKRNRGRLEHFFGCEIFAREQNANLVTQYIIGSRSHSESSVAHQSQNCDLVSDYVDDDLW